MDVLVQRLHLSKIDVDPIFLDLAFKFVMGGDGEICDTSEKNKTKTDSSPLSFFWMIVFFKSVN